MEVAIIGCGTIANAAHGPNYAKIPEAHIAYCVDIIPERARALAEKYGDADTRAIEDYRDMLKDPAVTAVSICVPNHLHAQISIDCLDAGKHVLCEKPAAMNLHEVQRMREAAARNDRILNIGVVNRFKASVNRVRDAIAAGELGDVYHVYCSFRSHRSIPGLGGPFTTKALSGGGVLIDWGVHFLDLISYCIGQPALRSVSAQAYGVLGKDIANYAYTSMWAGPPIPDGTYDVEEFITGLVRTETASITVQGAWAQNIQDNAMFVEFLGTKGGIKLDYNGGYTFDWAENGVLHHDVPQYAAPDMFHEELRAFLESARTNTRIRSHIEEVWQTTQLMDALYESARTHREVVFP